MGGRGRFAYALAGLVTILFLGEAAREVASRARAPVDFDVGPSTGAYLPGFTESEERLPVTFRWTRDRSSILIPLEADAERARLELRYARFLDESATVRLFVNGEPIASFSARPGRFRTHEVPVALASSGPLRIELLVEDPDPARLGIAVDWIRIENARSSLPSSAFAPRLFVVGVFLLTLALGFPLRGAMGVGGAVALGQAAWFARDPLAMAHALSQIAVTGLVATTFVAIAFRAIAGSTARYVPLLFLLGYALKGGALFHPSYFYSDVRLHRRHLEAFEASTGTILERGIAAQKSAFTAYPRRVAGRDYAFPYSPVFYLPFTLLERDPRGIEAAMKHVGLVLAALELPLVYLLARTLLGGGVALWASLLTVFLPPVVSRLLYAQWPTMAGHVLDLVAIFFAARMAEAGSPRGPMLLYGASGFLSSIVYISSLINLSAFSAFLAFFERKRMPALLLFWVLIAAAAVLLIYRPFTITLLTEILPALARGEGGGGGNPATGFPVSFLRIYSFYGLGFPALALAGFLVVRRDSE
ncbi:MAG: hypothetical protein ACRD21_01810, partial [Vicinamibacteria bacterium]